VFLLDGLKESMTKARRESKCGEEYIYIE